MSPATYKSGFKHLLDFLLSFAGLLVASPVFVVVTLLLVVANNGKPFFFQLRPGKNGRLFRIVKFKTMNDKCDAAGNPLPVRDGGDIGELKLDATIRDNSVCFYL